MVDKKYYEKLGGFSYVLGELRKKIGGQQTDALIQDAVNLCNELCEKYKGLPKKERIHTEGMIFPRAAFYLQMIKYIPRVDVLQCPYRKYCELLGCGELTATFCLSDDRIYGNMSGITFERQGTIGRGSDKCDFYFYRKN